MTAIVFKKGEFTMGKSANTFTGEGFDFFGFLENGLFGDKISALFDADSNMGRIITMIAAFIIAAAVLMIAAENLRAAVIFLSVSCLLLTAAGGIGSALARAAVFAAAAAGMAGIFTALRGRENTMKLIKDAV